MNTGLWKDPANAENGWESLHNMMPSERGRKAGLSMMDYLHGYCIQFAKALHEAFGYQMYGIWEHDGEEDIFVHAYCETPNGDVVDVRGITHQWDEFLDEFDDFIFDRRDIDEQPLDFMDIHDGEEMVVAREIIQELKEYYEWREKT